nr:wsc domain containing protein [Colletotrichum truncatum]KAF6796649.1 wsc domain containing protein [Colletotrichum truncatum]
MDSSYGQTGPQYSLPQNSDAAYVENGLHPVPADQTDKIINSAHYVPYDQYKPVPLSPDQGMKTSSLMPKKRICGVGRGMFILFCVLAFFIVALVVIAGLFGAMLANQSVEILDLKNTTPTKETSTAAAATTTWVEVNDWEFIGCWMDGDERIFPDKNVVIKNQTNRLCAAACAGYEYFGTEFGDQCYCSKTAPKTAAPAWNCDMHCAGAPNSEICGGYYFMSAWKRKSS